MSSAFLIKLKEVKASISSKDYMQSLKLAKAALKEHTKEASNGLSAKVSRFSIPLVSL